MDGLGDIFALRGVPLDGYPWDGGRFVAIFCIEGNRAIEGCLRGWEADIDLELVCSSPCRESCCSCCCAGAVLDSEPLCMTEISIVFSPRGSEAGQDVGRQLTAF